MNRSGKSILPRKIFLAAVISIASIALARAHHSFAMYDSDKIYNFTGVVTRVNPAAAHLILHLVPLDAMREKVVRDANGEPVEWTVEMGGSAASATAGVTVNSFPRGTIVSVGLHPLRSGGFAGGRGHSGLFKCPPQTPPAPGMHCDSVAGSTSHGSGVMQVPTNEWLPAD